jgi:hypothetical protein
MAQSLEVNIKTTSDVPQAMDKAKAATSGFQSQLDAIGKKFSTAFKDIALGFIAPMIILQSIISFISASIAKAKQDAKDGLELIAKGESRFSNPEEAKAGRYFKRRAELKEESRLVETGRAEITSQVLANEGGMFKDFELPEKFIRQLKEGSTTLDALAKNKEVQGLALEYFNKTDEGRKLSESLGLGASAAKAETMKDSPLGSGVIGVGASPQIALAMEANTKLDSIDSKLGELVNAGIARDPTKPLGRQFPLYSPGMSR